MTDPTREELNRWAASRMAELMPSPMPSVDVTDYCSDLAAAWKFAQFMRLKKWRVDTQRDYRTHPVPNFRHSARVWLTDNLDETAYGDTPAHALTLACWRAYK